MNESLLAPKLLFFLWAANEGMNKRINLRVQYITRQRPLLKTVLYHWIIVSIPKKIPCILAPGSADIMLNDL